MMLKQSPVPWIITLVMGIYVYGLTFHAKNQQAPEPSYHFYDTAVVVVDIRHARGQHDVFGQYHNIVEGKRQLVSPRQVGQGRYKLVFPVNSPRPATLYVDDGALQIFLVPGDTTLKVRMAYMPAAYRFDSLHFEGKLANVCTYYKDKSERFDEVRVRANRLTITAEDFSAFSAKQDSAAARELAFLAEREVFDVLPPWFTNFEKNEILYQKAYLKLSQAYNRDVPEALLDQVSIDNQGAVFSYYYYLYLRTYLARYYPMDSLAAPGDPVAFERLVTDHHMHIADSLLSDGIHDVFLTRTIFQYLQQDKLDIARELFRRYRSSFFSQKYVRFLEMQLDLKVPAS
ncbi:MAG: hypothetical protein OHK0039_02850 [Bacteroidia bacterium]